MRPGQQQNKQRIRGRGRKGPNPMSRSYESNGPDVKIRGTAQHVAEKYLTLARDASASGDRVMAENYLQHAEHYGRIVAAAQGSFQVQRDEREVEYDDDGEEIVFDDGPQGTAQPDAPQPQMRENGQNGQRDTYQRDNRDHQNRDGQNRDGQHRENHNRDGQPGQNRENRNNRDGNRDYQSRENRGERDGAREYQGRDGNPARDGNQNRDGQPREGQNRDGQPRENRGERNRENRGERNREFRQNRHDGEQQGERAAQAPVPSGLGPQPFIGLPPAAQSFESQPQPQPPVPSAEVQPEFRPVEVSTHVEVPSEIQADAPVRADGEPRRRGRPRRVRSEDGEAVTVETSAAPEPVVAPAPVETPVSEAAPSAPVVGDASEGEVKAKRRPGRPRKKKTDDEGPEDGGDHLPAFLMASNG